MLHFKKFLPQKENLKYVSGLIGWVIFYFIFLFIGGICMVAIEKDFDEDLKKRKHEQFLNVLSKHNVSVNNTVIKEIIFAAIAASDVGALNLADYLDTPATSWNLGVAVFFCSTVVTTIGYGNLVPLTKDGKLFTIFYATVGIPVTGIVLTKLGLALTSIILKCDNIIARYVHLIVGKVAKKEKVQMYVRLIQLLLILIMFVIFFWIIPAAIMTVTENWEMMTAIYFCFISITTIGLGDIVPGSSEGTGTPASQKIGVSQFKAIPYQLSVLLYLILGLAAISIIINLITSLITIVADSTISTAESIVTQNSKRIKRIATLKMGGSDSITSIESAAIDFPIQYTQTDGKEPEKGRERKKSAYEKFMDPNLLENPRHKISLHSLGVLSDQLVEESTPGAMSSLIRSQTNLFSDYKGNNSIPGSSSSSRDTERDIELSQDGYLSDSCSEELEPPVLYENGKLKTERYSDEDISNDHEFHIKNNNNNNNHNLEQDEELEDRGNTSIRIEVNEQDITNRNIRLPPLKMNKTNSEFDKPPDEPHFLLSQKNFQNAISPHSSPVLHHNPHFKTRRKKGDAEYDEDSSNV